MSQNPDPAALLATVLEAARAGDHARAATLAHSALAQGQEHPLLLNIAALGLEQQDRLPEAEQLLRRAVALAPGDPNVRNALALCLLRLERPAEALEQLDALLTLDPQLAYAHVGRGNALRALGNVAGAQSCFEKALTIDTRHPIAKAGLASIAAKRGEYPEARQWAQQALELIPGLPDAVMSLAAAELGERQLPQAEARVRALLADARLSAAERAYAQGLLGDVLDAAQQPDAAFAAYSRCNEELQRLHAGRFDSALDYVRRMVSYFGQAPLELWKARAVPQSCAPASSHIFIFGFPRSGTTLLEIILEGHPQVVSLDESELLIDGVSEFMRTPADLARLAVASPEELERLRVAYWRRVADAGVTAAGQIFVDKNPLNTLKLPLISRLFPDAKIVFACRDPRDIVLSCFRHRFQMSAPIYELLTIQGTARYYDAVMQLLIRLTSTLPLDVCLVRHEDVVTGFRREMRRLCDFLGLEWHPAMGDFALRGRQRTVLTPSAAQLARGLNTEGVGHWRRYREPLAPVMEILEPWVRQFYYDP